MRRTIAAPAAALVLLAASCALPPSPAQDACRPMLEAQLLFGLTDQAAFARFLDQSVTPRFPAGLTVLDGAGRWRAADGRMTQEASRVVMIVAPPGPETTGRLQAIRAEYRKAFHQESVGLVLTPVCADF